MTEKNYDPFMHTAEHILNGTMVKKYSIKRSFTNHIERKKSKCDYIFPFELSEEEVRSIEYDVNQIISSNLDVTEYFIKKEVAYKIFDLSKLPEETGDEIRIIKIGDYDECPCIGPHVNKTSEIGKFKIISTDFDNNVLRIRFKLER